MEKLNNIFIIKVGTSTLMRQRNDGSEELDSRAFWRIAKQIEELKAEGASVVVVSSAAITAGMVATGVRARPRAMPELQRLASIGWRHVVNRWDEALPEAHVGELLLTSRELSMKDERDEALRVTHQLLQCGDVPVANENDAVTHEEIAFGDNDTLAATFAAKIRHSPLFGDDVALIMLSDVDGVYEERGRPETRIRAITDIESCVQFARGASTSHGTGGMTTKFSAARIATGNDVPVWLASGKRSRGIREALQGKTGTHFMVDGARQAGVLCKGS